jgi:hypothetical protein
MIEIAGGIVMAVFVLILLPYLIIGVSGLVVLAMVVAVGCGAVWVISTSSVADIIAVSKILVIVAGIFLVWLRYEIKARRRKRSADSIGA